MATNLVIWYNIIAIISCGIIILFQLLFLSILFYKLHFSEVKQTVLKSIKYSTFLFYISLSMAYLMLMLSRIVYLNDMESDSWLYFFALYYSFSGFTLVAMYIFLIARLYETFKGTEYETKKMTIYIHLVCAFIGFLVMISVVIVGQFEDVGYKWVNLMVAVLIISVGVTHLMYLFNHYLFQQVLSERRETKKYKHKHRNSPTPIEHGQKEPQHTMDINSEEHEQTFSIELHHLQLELLATIRKHTLLSFMIIGAFLMGSLTPWFNIFCQTDLCHGIFWSVWYPLHCININIGGLSMYLGFSVNKPNYSRLCSICDYKCESLCRGLAKKRLKANDDGDNNNTYHE